MYYGWYIVAAGALLSTYSGIVSMYGFTAFLDPIAKTFGWSYTQISLATSIRGLESGALNPVMGFMVDRWPPKRLALYGVGILALGYFLFSRTSSLFTFYLSFIVMGFGGSLGVFMVPQTTIARWFRKDLGKASGVLFLGNGLSGLFIPLLVYSIDTFGWQICLRYFTFGLLLLGIPACLVFRTRPEDYGLLPDGQSRTQETNIRVGHGIPDHEMDLKGALKANAFWQLGIASFFQFVAWTAYATHLMPYFTSLGIERSLGGRTAMAVPLVSLVSRYPFGWLSDKFDKRYIMAMVLFLSGIGLLFFYLIDGHSMLMIILFIILTGISTGGMMPVRIPIYREYFGSLHFGKIYGLGNLFTTLGMILGSPLGGWIFDTLGYYDPLWLILSITTVMSAFLILSIPKSGHVNRY